MLTFEQRRRLVEQVLAEKTTLDQFDREALSPIMVRALDQGLSIDLWLRESDRPRH